MHTSYATTQDPKIRLARALLGMTGYITAMTANMLENEMRGISSPDCLAPHEAALELLVGVFEGLVAERGWQSVMRAARVIEDAWERAEDEIFVIDPEVLAELAEQESADVEFPAPRAEGAD